MSRPDPVTVSRRALRLLVALLLLIAALSIVQVTTYDCDCGPDVTRTAR